MLSLKLNSRLTDAGMSFQLFPFHLDSKKKGHIVMEKCLTLPGPAVFLVTHGPGGYLSPEASEELELSMTNEGYLRDIKFRNDYAFLLK